MEKIEIDNLKVTTDTNKARSNNDLPDVSHNKYAPIEILWSLFSSLVTSILESSPSDFMSSTVMYLYWCWSPSRGSSPVFVEEKKTIS